MGSARAAELWHWARRAARVKQECIHIGRVPRGQRQRSFVFDMDNLHAAHLRRRFNECRILLGINVPHDLHGSGRTDRQLTRDIGGTLPACQKKSLKTGRRFAGNCGRGFGADDPGA